MQAFYRIYLRFGYLETELVDGVIVVFGNLTRVRVTWEEQRQLREGLHPDARGQVCRAFA